MGACRQQWMPFRPPFLTAGEQFVKNTISSKIKLRENRQNLQVFNLWPVIYHTEKNSCGNPTPETLSVEIYTSRQNYPKSTHFYFVAIDVSQQKTVPV
jgi:hypothetical protein